MPIRSASPSNRDEIRSTLKEHGRPSAGLAASEMQRFLVCRTERSIDDRLAMLRTIAILPRHRLETEGGDVCGVVGFEIYGSVALIHSLVVVPGKGSDTTGTRLLGKIEQKAREEGAERLYLLTTNPKYFEDRDYNRAKQEAVPEPIANSKITDRCPPEAAVMTKRLRPEGSSESSRTPAEPGTSTISFRNLVYTK